ncbi:four helix bundle protein [Ferrimonas pelagia]|uniref:Four helix bundle protein n=1 Tax=Ferrimonas pelagia TaxID=1177826 RepID=A0ABP9EEB1_9GAMM
MDFEKLEVWQRAFHLSCELYKRTDRLRDLALRSQLTRSGLSVPSNIAEGMARRSDKDKLRFLDIARASLAELRTQAIIGAEIQYLETDFSNFCVAETRELGAMLTGLMKWIEQKL